jgi:hypothetical protein
MFASTAHHLFDQILWLRTAVDAAEANALMVRKHRGPRCFLLGPPENLLNHPNHELHWCLVVVQKHHIVHWLAVAPLGVGAAADRSVLHEFRVPTGCPPVRLAATRVNATLAPGLGEASRPPSPRLSHRRGRHQLLRSIHPTPPTVPAIDQAVCDLNLDEPGLGPVPAPPVGALEAAEFPLFRSPSRECACPRAMGPLATHSASHRTLGPTNVSNIHSAS